MTNSKVLRIAGAILILALVISLLPMMTSEEVQAAQWQWQTSVVDEGKMFGDVSVAIGSDGRIHIAYGGGQLYYAVWNGSVWETQRVEKLEGGTGYDCSLALDSSGNPAIAYVASLSGYMSDLRYTHWDGSQWNTETVDSPRGSLEYISLAFDSSGYPAISYSGNGINYAHWNGTSWDKAVVDSKSGWYTSLAFDHSGNPAISYYTLYGYDLKYARWNASAWDIQTVDSEGDVGSYTSLAFNSLGNPAISYLDQTNCDLKYAQWNGTAWEIQTVDSGNVNPILHGTSLAFDPTGKPGIAYAGAFNLLTYAYWDGSKWGKQLVVGGDVSIFNMSLDCSLDFDAAGHAVIAYCGGSLLDVASVRCACLSGTNWYMKKIDQNGGMYHCSLAIDSNGKPAITYSDGLSTDVNYAHWDGVAWIIQAVDSQGGARTVSLAFDSIGNPATSYIIQDASGTDDQLKYAHWNGSSWDVEIVDVGSDLRDVSLAFDHAGNPAISYSDWENNDLKYAHWNGSSWNTQIVDSAGTVGDCSSLAFDSSGRPAISYHDLSNNALKYAHWDGSTWDIEVVDNQGDVGWSTSLAFNASGSPAISYASHYPSPAATNQIKYAHWDSSEWIVQNVSNSSDDIGWDDTSLAFDSLDNPAIAYGSDMSDKLMFAHFNGTAWDIKTIDETYGGVGEYASLAFDSSGNPAISYCDSTNGDVKYASGVLDQPPDQPSNVSPANASNNISLTPIFSSSAFSDPDAGDTQAASQWQIRTSSGAYNTPTLNTTSSTNLTQITIPSGTLSYNMTYYWRVRYQDNYGSWSNWSAETSFTTVANQPPNQPSNVLPANASNNISLTPIFSSSAFSDPDAGDTQAACQWQIRTSSGNYNTPTLNTTSSTNLTQIPIPSGTLSYNITYYWRVRYGDNYGSWSNWSAETSFTTVANQPPNQPANTSPNNWWIWLISLGAIGFLGMLIAGTWLTYNRVRMRRNMRRWEEEGYDLSEWK